MNQSYRRWSSFIALISLAGCQHRPAPAVVTAAPVPAPRPAGAPRVAWTQGPLTSTKVPPRELWGVVVDEATGKPIDFAQVISARLAHSVVADSAGRFQLRLPNGALSLYVARIGFEPSTMTLTPHRDSGYVVVIALRKAEVRLCSVNHGPSDRIPGVVVRVVDAQTGQAPTGEVTVLARDGAFRDSVTVQADSEQRLSASAARDRPGQYDVTVRSAGYHDWHGEGATGLACPGQFSPAFFRVWLIPR